MLCFRLMGLKRAVALSAFFATVVPFPAPAEEPEHIYVYAIQLTPAHSWLPISCGGVVAAELKRGRFFAIDAPPGRYTLTPRNGVPSPVEVRPGEDAFVRLDWRMESGRPAIPVLAAVSPDLARRQMNWLTYIDVKRIFSSAVPRSDPRRPAELRLKRRPRQ